MPPTDLIVMRATLHGWFDTGSTTAEVNVGKYHYEPEAAVSKRLSERHELFGYSGECFLSETVEQDLTRHLMKALGTFTTAMCLP